MKSLLKILVMSISAICIITLVTSCAKVGLMSNKSSTIPIDINSVAEFFKVFLRLQISMILIAVILGLGLDKLGAVVSTLLHLIWIVTYRDYGFFIVLLLFVGGSLIITFALPLIMIPVHFIKGIVNNIFFKKAESED